MAETGKLPAQSANELERSSTTRQAQWALLLTVWQQATRIISPLEQPLWEAKLSGYPLELVERVMGNLIATATSDIRTRLGLGDILKACEQQLEADYRQREQDDNERLRKQWEQSKDRITPEQWQEFKRKVGEIQTWPEKAARQAERETAIAYRRQLEHQFCAGMSNQQLEQVVNKAKFARLLTQLAKNAMEPDGSGNADATAGRKDVSDEA